MLGERGVPRERRVWCGQGDRVWGVVRDDGQVTWTEGGQARREQEAGEGEAGASRARTVEWQVVMDGYG